MKATYGRFNTEAAISANYNQYTTFQTVYRWSDPNHNGRYDPVNSISHHHRGDFLSTTRAANNAITRPQALHVNESPHRRALGRAESRVRDCTSSTRMAMPTAPLRLRPYSAVNILSRARFPVPTGAQHSDDAGMSLSRLHAAFAAAISSQPEVNRPRAPDYYSSLSSIMLRMTQSCRCSRYTCTKYHRWIAGSRIARTTSTSSRRSVRCASSSCNYNFPNDISFGTIVE